MRAPQRSNCLSRLSHRSGPLKNEQVEWKCDSPDLLQNQVRSKRICGQNCATPSRRCGAILFDCTQRRLRDTRRCAQISTRETFSNGRWSWPRVVVNHGALDRDNGTRQGRDAAGLFCCQRGLCRFICRRRWYAAIRINACHCRTVNNSVLQPVPALPFLSFAPSLAFTFACAAAAFCPRRASSGLRVSALLSAVV